MATVEAYDPRELIRQTIGTQKLIRGADEEVYVLVVTNDYGDSINVPLYKPYEVHKNNPPELPFVEMKVMTSPAETMNIGGDVHKSMVYLDFDIMFVPTTLGVDNTFGEDVASEIIDKIMDNRSCIGFFCEVVNDGREYYEGVEGKGVIYHRIVELYTYKTQKK